MKEQVNWFLYDFNLNYLKQTSGIKRWYYTNTADKNKALFDSILTELNKEWEHLQAMQGYSQKGVGSPKSAAAYIRDDLLLRTISPFKDVYDEAKFKKLFLAGDSRFELFLFKYAKKEFNFLIKTYPPFSFANEKLQVLILDRIVTNFEKFCCFELATEEHPT